MRVQLVWGGEGRDVKVLFIGFMHVLWHPSMCGGCGHQLCGGCGHQCVVGVTTSCVVVGCVGPSRSISVYTAEMLIVSEPQTPPAHRGLSSGMCKDQDIALVLLSPAYLSA